jgi:pimeloyl-ACP methyl ester carboxylesterase
LRMALPVIGDRIYTSYRRDPQAAYDSLRPFYGNIDALPEADRNFLFQRVNERVWSDTQRRAYLGLYQSLTWSAPRRQSAFESALARLAVPTRLIWGEHDHIMPLDVAHGLLDLQPRAGLTMVPGAGHLPHQEQPEAFLQALSLETIPQLR